MTPKHLTEKTPGSRQCLTCGGWSMSPIEVCKRCFPDDYAAAFRHIREEASTLLYVDSDPYSDALYWTSIDKTLAYRTTGILHRFGESRSHAALVDRLRELENENRDVLAENARLRRRLEGR